MSDINQNVNINVNANTQDATNEVSRLENNIRTLDGAVNLVGGSIEVLAGSLALSGAVTEEQAERFETAAVGAIALADGAKRALEGFRTLATETKVLSQAQKALNVIMNANPIYLVVGAVAALTAAYFALNSETETQVEDQKDLNDELERQNTILGNTISFYSEKLAIARAQGVTGSELTKTEIEALEEEAALRRQQTADLRAQQNELIRFRRTGSKEVQAQREEDIKALDEEISRREQAYATLLSKIRVANAQLQTELNTEEEQAAEQAEQAATYQAAQSETKIELRKKELTIGLDVDKQLQDSALRTADVQRQTVLARTAAEEAAAEKRKQIAEQEEAYKQALLTSGIDNIQGALSALFGENKAVASANVLIDAAQAGVGIIKNSQTTGPFAIAYQATQFALLAATTIASLRQINSAEPGSTGAPNIPRGGGGIPTAGTFTTAGAGGVATITPTGFQSPTIRAYVVAGDVTSGQEADAQLLTRRQFP